MAAFVCRQPLLQTKRWRSRMALSPCGEEISRHDQSICPRRAVPHPSQRGPSHMTLRQRFATMVLAGALVCTGTISGTAGSAAAAPLPTVSVAARFDLVATSAAAALASHGHRPIRDPSRRGVERRCHPSRSRRRPSAPGLGRRRSTASDRPALGADPGRRAVPSQCQQGRRRLRLLGPDIVRLGSGRRGPRPPERRPDSSGCRRAQSTPRRPAIWSTTRAT